jgi:hypothetical protein
VSSFNDDHAVCREIFLADKETIASLREQLRLAQEQKWLPMESAPRDGTKFLGWYEVPVFDEDTNTTKIDHEQCVCYWFSFFGNKQPEASRSGSFIPFPYRGKFTKGMIVKKWHPLPAPPTKVEGSK